MDKDEKIISRDARFEYFQKEFLGWPITMRRHLTTGDVDLMLDDNFAKANDFADLREFLSAATGVELSEGDARALANRVKWWRPCLNGTWHVVDAPVLGSVGEA